MSIKQTRWIRIFSFTTAIDAKEVEYSFQQIVLALNLN